MKTFIIINMFRKKYRVKVILRQLDELYQTGKKTIDLLELLTEIGFVPSDISEFDKDLIGRRKYYYRDMKDK